MRLCFGKLFMYFPFLPSFSDKVRVKALGSFGHDREWDLLGKPSNTPESFHNLIILSSYVW